MDLIIVSVCFGVLAVLASFTTFVVQPTQLSLRKRLWYSLPIAIGVFCVGGAVGFVAMLGTSMGSQVAIASLLLWMCFAFGGLYGVDYSEEQGAWRFAVPSASSAVYGLALFLGILIAAPRGLLTIFLGDLLILIGLTGLCMFSFVWVALGNGLRHAFRGNSIQSEPVRLHKSRVVNTTLLLFIVLFLGIKLLYPALDAETAVSNTVETADLEVRYLSLESRDGVAVLRFSEERGRSGQFYSLPFASEQAKLVGLGERLRVTYRASSEHHRHDREVISIEVAK